MKRLKDLRRFSRSPHQNPNRPLLLSSSTTVPAHVQVQFFSGDGGDTQRIPVTATMPDEIFRDKDPDGEDSGDKQRCNSDDEIDDSGD
ncbi:hypothetical protein MRB53_012086 [Persea americana]|uniref:Uncharacterized protein n=1 Tax=Persea americana TaxID=3435 RepID=A0ACC2LWU5_PERAE|nr:hypothetical protein MRB53_012086 [Persea americana]